MKTNQHRIDHTLAGNTLVVTVAVVAFILALLASAISFTEHVSRNSQRSRKAALAMEIADGHLEYLFTNWRNIYRKTWTTTSSGGTDDVVLATNYFFTSCSTCSPAPVSSPAPTAVPNMNPAATPPTIALPDTTNFPTEPNYTVTQYRVQAVDPMIELNGVAGTTCTGANSEDACVETAVGSGNFTRLSAASPPPAAF